MECYTEHEDSENEDTENEKEFTPLKNEMKNMFIDESESEKEFQFGKNVILEMRPKNMEVEEMIDKD